MKYGYARRSRSTQGIDNQKERLTKLGAEVVLEETASGRSLSRKTFNTLVDETLEAGDELVVTEISRLGRNALELLKLRDKLLALGVALTVDGKTFDFKNRTDRLTYALQAVIYENESENIGDRVRRAVAARNGASKGGRPAALTETQKTWVWKRVREQGWSYQDCMKEYKCSRNSIIRAVELVDERKREELARDRKKQQAGEEQ